MSMPKSQEVRFADRRPDRGFPLPLATRDRGPFILQRGSWWHGYSRGAPPWFAPSPVRVPAHKPIVPRNIISIQSPE